jgi:hypothetical protein
MGVRTAVAAVTHPASAVSFSNAMLYLTAKGVGVDKLPHPIEDCPKPITRAYNMHTVGDEI